MTKTHNPAPDSNLRPAKTAEDAEFLPAALELVETPPSPIRIALIYFCASFVVVALAWAWIGRLDVIAIAQGKIQPPGRVKVIQPSESGRVAQIKVTNGQKVEAGEVLVEFDTTEARADVEALEAASRALRAEIERRGVAITLAQAPEQIQLDAAIPFSEGMPNEARERENQVLRADLSHLLAAIAALDAQTGLKQREHQRLAETMAVQTELVKTLQERVNMRTTLLGSGTGSRSSVMDSMETLLIQRTVLASQAGQLREIEASMRVLSADRARMIQSFLTENTLKRSEASKTLDEVTQRLNKARSRLRNLVLQSPIDGQVVASSINSTGQVVSAGQEVMRIVPLGEKLEVEAYFFNKDIGFVQAGQTVTIKVDSFPYTRYGTLTGTVQSVASDAIPLSEAQQIEGNPIRPGEGALFAGAQRTQNLVFPVTIALDSTSLAVYGRQVTMSSGMTVTAEIRTGSRRIIEYLFSPIAETTSEAMRER